MTEFCVKYAITGCCLPIKVGAKCALCTVRAVL